MPQMFTDGTPEHQSAETYRRQLLNFRTAAEQDAIIAKLLKIDHQEREERDGVARYTRVALKKDAANQQGATTAKVVTTKPSPKPSGTAMTSQPAMRQLGGSTTRQQIAQRLRDACRQLMAQEEADLMWSPSSIITISAMPVSQLIMILNWPMPTL